MAAAELLGLSALVVAQPIFDALQRSTYAFPSEGIGGSELLIFAALLVLLPPACMLVVELVAGIPSRSLRGWTHLVWIGLLLAILAWQTLIHAGDAGRLARLVIPAAVFVAGAVLYVRLEAARTLLRILGFAAPITACLFLFTSPISSFTLKNPDIPRPEFKAKTPVVLIVFDEFPIAALLNEHQQIDARRFPHFSALADHSLWFHNATTVADSTEQAVPAILTGDFPKPNGVATFEDHPENLFTLLGASYETDISESETHLCPPEICQSKASLPARVALLARVGSEVANSFPFNLTTRVARRLEGWWAPEMTQPHQQVARFLANLRAPAGGSLNVMHVELPHVKWQYMPSGRRYQSGLYPLGTTQEQWSLSPGYAIQGLQRLMLQLRYTDRVLGRIVASLRRAGLYKRALVAVVADHGASFIPGRNRRLISPETSGWIARVPLFVKLPGQDRGKVVRRPVRTIDLLPTIADVLNIRIPWHVDGTSLLGGPANRDDRFMSYRETLTHIPPGAIRRSFLAALALRNGFFGQGNLFTLGASPRELRSQLRDAVRLQTTVDSPWGTTFDPRSGVYPSLIFGRILDPLANGADRLIATLNGRPVAAAESVDGGTAFTTVIPPSAFRPGANKLAIYAPG